MTARTPDFKARAAEAHARLGPEGAARLLAAGHAWDLAPTLRAGGALLFPHVGVEKCGHQIGAAVHACLDCGADTVLVLGVLHALTDELEEARVRVADGGDVAVERAWGIEGPGLGGRLDWEHEFSLSHFLWLWENETARRGIAPPRMIVRYPYLAGGRPGDLPGIKELEAAAKEAAVVATGDLFHHGVGYGDSETEALAPDEGGLDLARERITRGLDILARGDYWGYNSHSVTAKSDARDVGQVLRHLIGPFEARILDIVTDDMSGAYGQPEPTWVAGALTEFVPVGSDR